MTDSTSRGDPLDAAEIRALQEIERRERASDPDFAQRVGDRPGVFHPPIRQTGTPLRPRVVAGVLGAALVFAVLLVLVVPDRFVIPAVLVTLLGVGPVCCLVWARRSGEL